MQTHAKKFQEPPTQMRRGHRFRLDDRTLDKVLQVNPTLAGDSESRADAKARLLQPAPLAAANEPHDLNQTALGLFLRGAAQAWQEKAHTLHERQAALRAEEAQTIAQLRQRIECFLHVLPSDERPYALQLIEKHTDLFGAVGLSPRQAFDCMNK